MYVGVCSGAFFFANSLLLVPHWDLHCRTPVWWRRGACVCVCVCYSGGRNPFDGSNGLGRPHLILRQELQRRQEQLLATLWKWHQAKGHYKTDCFMNSLLYAQTHNHANTRIHPHAYIHTMKMAIRGMPTWGQMLWATKGGERGT